MNISLGTRVQAGLAKHGGAIFYACLLYGVTSNGGGLGSFTRKERGITPAHEVLFGCRTVPVPTFAMAIVKVSLFDARAVSVTGPRHICRRWLTPEEIRSDAGLAGEAVFVLETFLLGLVKQSGEALKVGSKHAYAWATYGCPYCVSNKISKHKIKLLIQTQTVGEAVPCPCLNFIGHTIDLQFVSYSKFQKVLE